MKNWKACYAAQSYTDPETNELHGQLPFEVVLVPKPRKQNEYEQALARKRAKQGYIEIDEESMDVDCLDTSDDADSEEAGRSKKRVPSAKRGRNSKVKSKPIISTSDESEEDPPRKKAKPTRVAQAAVAGQSSRRLRSSGVGLHESSDAAHVESTDASPTRKASKSSHKATDQTHDEDVQGAASKKAKKPRDKPEQADAAVSSRQKRRAHVGSPDDIEMADAHPSNASSGQESPRFTAKQKGKAKANRPRDHSDDSDFDLFAVSKKGHRSDERETFELSGSDADADDDPTFSSTSPPSKPAAGAKGLKPGRMAKQKAIVIPPPQIQLSTSPQSALTSATDPPLTAPASDVEQQLQEEEPDSISEPYDSQMTEGFLAIPAKHNPPAPMEHSPAAAMAEDKQLEFLRTLCPEGAYQAMISSADLVHSFNPLFGLLLMCLFPVLSEGGRIHPYHSGIPSLDVPSPPTSHSVSSAQR